MCRNMKRCTAQANPIAAKRMQTVQQYDCACIFHMALRKHPIMNPAGTPSPTSASSSSPTEGAAAQPSANAAAFADTSPFMQGDELPDAPLPGWIQGSLSEDELQALPGETPASTRIWQGFMTARAMVAFLLLAWQGMEVFFRATDEVWILALCTVYLVATLRTRWLLKPVAAGQPFERYWLWTLGLDFWVYFLLLWFGHGSMNNYIPLLGLPLIICAVLGTRRMMLFTAALATLLISIINWRYSVELDLESALMHYALVALYLLAVFLVASVLHRMARNYGAQKIRAQASVQMLRLQGRIQDMVVQSVRDGVLVVGSSGRLRAINKVAQRMLHMPLDTRWIGRPITTIAHMEPLQHLITQSLTDQEGTSSEVFLFPAEDQAIHLMVHSRISQPVQESGTATPPETLCLLYLQDMQELQQQVRTEKLAAMGRMSAAVAHEIRNPLAAIGQAAELLEEELTEPLQKKLNGMVQANVVRLGRVVSDVLDIARMQQYPTETHATLLLDATVRQLCDEWLGQNQPWQGAMHMALHAPEQWAHFESEHLRRIMVNLLDNAKRHGQQDKPLILVGTHLQDQAVHLQVWSRGAPLLAAVQARLFEPFAAGPSRSTGLGLYICRELCQRYQADIHYQRLPLSAIWGKAPVPIGLDGQEEGNVFSIWMKPASESTDNTVDVPHRGNGKETSQP